MVLNVAVLLTVTLRPMPLLDDILSLPDDAYLSLQLARNIAHGLGPWYGLAHTNGFQPLYVFLMVPAFWVWPTDPETPVRAALFLLSLFNVATLIVLFRWMQRLTGSALVAVIVGLIWVLNFYVLFDTLNGLETAISVFFIAAALSQFHLLAESDALDVRRMRWLGPLLGLAIFARIDNFILAAVLWTALLIRHRRDPALPKALLSMTAIAALVTLPWWIYSWHYTGTLFPVSGPAVRFRSLTSVSHAPTFANFYAPMFGRAFLAVWQKNTELICGFVAVAILGRVLGPSAGRARWTVVTLLAYAATMLVAYATYVVAPWYFSRYLYPLILVLLPLFALALHRLLEGTRANPLLHATALLAGLVVIGAQVARPQFLRLFTAINTRQFGYMNIGLWAKDQFPAGTRLGSSQSGALAYFAPELTVVNLDGVVNRQGFDALREHRAMAYVRDSRLQYLVNWERDVQFLLVHSPLGEEENVHDLGPVPGFRSWNNIWHTYEVRPTEAMER